MASNIFVNFGSGNGLSPVRRQAITWTSVDLLTFGLSERNLNSMKIEAWTQENVSENVACKLAAILFLSQCVDY